MPTYEYVCKSCGHLFEIVQSMKDDALTECPECGGELRKVFAPPAISFKGSGFYATDHRQKSKSPSGGGKKPDGGDASKPAATSGEGGGVGDSGSGKEDSGGAPAATEKGTSSRPAAKPAATTSD
jgi:putative FmdB family regulatory protein